MIAARTLGMLRFLRICYKQKNEIHYGGFRFFVVLAMWL